VGLLPDYARQAERYDETRSASPSVLRVLRKALAGAPGRRLADIGGGTGNYALALSQKGWEPIVVDRSPGMLARAAAKGLETVEADAERLPFGDESFDAATMISMLHHVDDRRAALAEARRILKPGGLLVLKGFTGEDAATLWILDYFPCSRPWMEATHPPLAAILAELPGARLFPFRFEDMRDASLAALSAEPERVIEAAERGATSYFERLRRDHPDELRAGLAQLRADVAARRAPRRAGTATVLSWTKRYSPAWGSSNPTARIASAGSEYISIRVSSPSRSVHTCANAISSRTPVLFDTPLWRTTASTWSPASWSDSTSSSQSSQGSVHAARNARVPSGPSYVCSSGQPLKCDMSQTNSGATMSTCSSPVAMKRS
jgi:demethylmenaquinone methyltransferase/2-methoxy-6-polyprenyl-1,4-benzoquinol methylase